MNFLNIIGRDKELFSSDTKAFDDSLKSIVLNSRFLVIGGAGSIGQALTKEIFKSCLLYTSPSPRDRG